MTLHGVPDRLTDREKAGYILGITTGVHMSGREEAVENAVRNALLQIAGLTEDDLQRFAADAAGYLEKLSSANRLGWIPTGTLTGEKPS